MAETLYELAIEAAGLTGSETVYDLYCGTGTIGLSLAAKSLTVWGVEISEEAVACAIENATANGITNASFFAGNVGQSIEELRERSEQPDVVVVDPPRAGLAGKALRRTGALEAPRIVYVSCNPTTLASDRRGAAGRVRLRAQALHARGHVPPHAAHRIGQPARALGLTRTSVLEKPGRREGRLCWHAKDCPPEGRLRSDEGSGAVLSRVADHTRRRSVRYRRFAVLALGVLAFVVAGCGGDDSTSASSDETTVEETTATEDTTEEETTATESTTEDVDLGDLSGDCLEFAGVGAKIAEAMGASGATGDLSQTAELFDELVDNAPDEIKSDLETLSGGIAKMAEALQGVDLTSGANPRCRDACEVARGHGVDRQRGDAGGLDEDRGLGEGELHQLALDGRSGRRALAARSRPISLRRVAVGPPLPRRANE